MHSVDSAAAMHSAESLKDVTKPGQRCAGTLPQNPRQTQEHTQTLAITLVRRWQRSKVTRLSEDLGSSALIHDPILNKGGFLFLRLPGGAHVAEGVASPTDRAACANRRHQLHL